MLFTFKCLKVFLFFMCFFSGGFCSRICLTCWNCHMILKLCAWNAISLNTTYLLSHYVSCKCFGSSWMKEFCKFKSPTLYLEAMIYRASGEGTTAYQCVQYCFLALYAHNRPPLQLKVLWWNQEQWKLGFPLAVSLAYVSGICVPP